jgi:hypothetical protein
MSEIKSKGGAPIEEGDTVSTPVSAVAFHRINRKKAYWNSTVEESTKGR